MAERITIAKAREAWGTALLQTGFSWWTGSDDLLIETFNVALEILRGR